MAIPQHGFTSAFFDPTLSCIHPVALPSAVPVGDGGAIGPPHSPSGIHLQAAAGSNTHSPASQSKADFNLSSVGFWKGKRMRTHCVLLYIQAVRLMLQAGLAQSGPKVPSGHTLSPAFPKYRVGTDCSPSKRQQHSQSAT